MRVLRIPALGFQGRNADNFANASLQMNPCFALSSCFVGVGMGISLGAKLPPIFNDELFPMGRSKQR